MRRGNPHCTGRPTGAMALMPQRLSHAENEKGAWMVLVPPSTAGHTTSSNEAARGNDSSAGPQDVFGSRAKLQTMAELAAFWPLGAPGLSSSL